MKNKEVVIEYTEEDVAEMRADRIDEDAIPSVGKHVFRRGGFRERHPNFNRKESKVRINIYVDLDVLNYFRSRAEQPNAAPYQTQINAELRKIMEHDQTGKNSKAASAFDELLENDEFLSKLSEKLKERERQAA